ncbi:hypothetical protein K504DRAFT_503047 [Pleomassaria siparia CBS 279.74]|uniref:Uncharacterized protein n=1 Tax=Pleomassaria siparia CBS 279.74 TaxID=1314801 RepID=A0A6G1K834_9PLEO|nr:hypothetical protein K504DRAFT_503047 [Pleomassaria siparia CBS 279.74]
MSHLSPSNVICLHFVVATLYRKMSRRPSCLAETIALTHTNPPGLTLCLFAKLFLRRSSLLFQFAIFVPNTYPADRTPHRTSTSSVPFVPELGIDDHKDENQNSGTEHQRSIDSYDLSEQRSRPALRLASSLASRYPGVATQLPCPVSYVLCLVVGLKFTRPTPQNHSNSFSPLRLVGVVVRHGLEV